MLRLDVTVDRPAGTKIQTRNGKRYVYQVTSSTWDSKKRQPVETRIAIGRMVSGDRDSEDKRMYPNARFHDFYPETSEGLVDAPQFSSTLKVGGMMMVNQLLHVLQLDKLLKGIYEDDYTKIVNLISYSLLFESSTYQHYPELMRNHPTADGRLMSDGTICEFLKQEEQEERIKLTLQAWNQLNANEDAVYISYDSTNISNQSTSVELAEPGHPKIDIGVPQINISVAMNQSSRLPSFYELYPGSIVDVSQCEHMVAKAKDYGYKKAGFILDRGYFSAGNIRYFDENHYEFIVMLKGNCKASKENTEALQKQIHQFRGKYWIASHQIYGTTVKGHLWKNDQHTRYFHVYYDNIRAAAASNNMMAEFDRMEETLQKFVDKKTVKTEDVPKPYHQAFHLKSTSEYLSSFTRNETFIQNTIDEEGFFVIVTSEKMSAEEALDIYKDRDCSEKLFRMLKSDLDYDKTAVYSDQSTKTKTHLIFLAAIIRSELFQKLKPVEVEMKDRKNYTVNAAIHTLENIEVTKNATGSYMHEYALTKKQKKIFNALSLTEDDINTELKTINSMHKKLKSDC